MIKNLNNKINNFVLYTSFNNIDDKDLFDYKSIRFLDFKSDLEKKNFDQDDLGEFLSNYGVDMTLLARRGQYDIYYGRENELSQLLEILARRQKNNPILVGNPGVGKTTIVEMLASKIASGTAPLIFEKQIIYSLDITKIIEESRFPGEFEYNLSQILKELIYRPNIIVFIDEIHTIIKTEQQEEGALNASAILKPVLSRGSFRCISTTGEKEYEMIQKNESINRCFEKVLIKEATLQEAKEMLYALREGLEQYHNVIITSEAIKLSVELSSRYIQDKFLPDKAIDLLDQASAKKVVTILKPFFNFPLGEFINSGLKTLDLLKKQAFKQDDINSGYTLTKLIGIYKNFLIELKNLIHLEKSNFKIFFNKSLTNSNNYIHILQNILNSYLIKNFSIYSKVTTNLIVGSLLLFEKFLIKIPPLLNEIFLNDLAKNSPIYFNKKELESAYLLMGFLNYSNKKPINFNKKELIFCKKNYSYATKFIDQKEYINEEDICNLMSEIVGIPITSINSIESENLLNLETTLTKRVIGQKEAISAISKAVRRSRVGIQNPRRPMASFLFCGPTGVGKTEATKALALTMFGSENEMIRFDMSEFMEKFSITRLIGSPPGYIGYGEGGELTEAVRIKPYSIVLFDEIEKAHPEILNIFLQILEDGRLTDSKRRLVSFENTIIIMTSNAASENIQNIIENKPKYHATENNTLHEKDQEVLTPKQKISRKYPSKYITTLLEKNYKKKASDILYSKKIDENIDIKTPEEEEIALDKELKIEVMECLSNMFLPEFLNRLDDVIVFQPLKVTDLKKICDLMIESLINRLQKKDIKLIVGNDVRLKLTSDGYSPKFGARPLRRVITKALEDLITDEILRNKREENKNKTLILSVELNSVKEIIVQTLKNN